MNSCPVVWMVSTHTYLASQEMYRFYGTCDGEARQWTQASSVQFGADSISM
jgi:hypothetical protein